MDVVFLLHLRMRSLRWAYKYPTFARPLRSHIPPRCKRTRSVHQGSFPISPTAKIPFQTRKGRLIASDSGHYNLILSRANGSARPCRNSCNQQGRSPPRSIFCGRQDFPKCAGAAD